MASNYLALPTGGCLLDQPHYIYHDLMELRALDGWYGRRAAIKRARHSPGGRQPTQTRFEELWTDE